MEVPSTREALLEHLFLVIGGLVPSTLTARVTGMFAECSREQLLHLLTNQDILHSRVKQALSALQGESSDNSIHSISATNETDKLELGDQLFEAVTDVETELSAQVTGMLLELSPTTIKTLLANPTDLKTAVHKARTEYLKAQHLAPPGGNSNNKCQNDTAERNCDVDSLQDLELVGHRLYEHVAKIYPRNAAKVTGMLMELGSDELCLLLENEDELKDKINTSKLTLENHEQWISES